MCNDCSRIFPSHPMLLKHIFSELQEYQNRIANLVDQLRITLAPSTQPADEIDYIAATTVSSPSQQTPALTLGTPHVCPDTRCKGKHFTRDQDFVRHFASHRRCSPNNSNCPVCNANFDFESKVLNHKCPNAHTYQNHKMLKNICNKIRSRIKTELDLRQNIRKQKKERQRSSDMQQSEHPVVARTHSPNASQQRGGVVFTHNNYPSFEAMGNNQLHHDGFLYSQLHPESASQREDYLQSTGLWDNYFDSGTMSLDGSQNWGTSQNHHN
ncbi:hypothetical protein F4824DRAFT_271135 [Ustulina deusta]|nr:hypothetical protein F4824DRAFT_271135 [Ustulina deusta]